MYSDPIDCCSDYMVTHTRQRSAHCKKLSPGSICRSGNEAQVLLAAVPQPKGQTPLPCVAKELEEIKQIVPKNVIVRIPAEEDCTTDSGVGTRVRTAVELPPHASIIHLACHGC